MRHTGHTCFTPNDRSPSTHAAWKMCEHGSVEVGHEDKGSRQMMQSKAPVLFNDATSPPLPSPLPEGSCGAADGARSAGVKQNCL